VLLVGPARAQVPGTAAERLAVGNQRAALAQYASALQAYRQAAVLDPRSAQAQYGIGWCNYTLGRLAPAQEALRTALHLDPHHQAAALTLGEVYLAQRKWSEAEATFRRLRVLYPGDYLTQLGLARAQTGRGQTEAARQSLEQAIRLRPDQARPRVLLGRLYLARQSYEAAQDALLTAYNLDPDFEPAWGELLRLYEALDRPADQQSFLSRLLARHPNDVHLWQTQLRLARAGRNAAGQREALAQLITLSRPQAGLVYRRELARTYLTDRQYPEAVSELQAALAVAPHDPELTLLLGQALLAQGQRAAAGRLLAEIRPEQITDPELLLILAQTQLAKGQPEAARATAERALQATELPGALVVAQQASRELGEGEATLRWGRRLLARDPASADQRLDLAHDLTTAGHYGEALQQAESLAEPPEPRTSGALALLAGLTVAVGNPPYQLSVERRRVAAGGTPTALVELLLAQGRYREASAALAGAGTTNDPDLLALRLRLLRRTGQPEVAAALLDRALQRWPVHGGLNLEMGELLAAQGNPVAAWPCLRQGLIAEPEAGEGYAALVTSIRQSGQFQPAQDLLLALIASPASRRAALAPGLALDSLTELYEAQGGLSGATRELEALAQVSPGRPELALQAAREAERAGEPQRALSLYQLASLHPAAAESALRRAAQSAAAAHDQAGLLAVAGEYFSRVVPDPELLAWAAEAQSTALPAPVEGALEALLAAPSGSWEYQRRRVELLAATDRLAVAEGSYACRAAAGSARDIYALALVQEQRGELALALQTAETLPLVVRDEPEVAGLQARLLRRQGRLEEALARLEPATPLDSALVAQERAEALAGLGRYEEAAGEVGRALVAGAPPAEALARLEEWRLAGKLPLLVLVAALEQAAEALPDAGPLSQYVHDKLPASDPAVQQWGVARGAPPPVAP
jgi:tetratricopeptide (TPR) repeat protein